MWLDAGEPIRNVPMSLRNDGHKILEEGPLEAEAKHFKNFVEKVEGETPWRELGERPTRRNDRPTDEALKSLSDSFEAKQPWEVLEVRIEHVSAPDRAGVVSGRKTSRSWIWCIASIPRRRCFISIPIFCFPKHSVRDRIVARYGLKPAQVVRMKPLLTPEQQVAQHGEPSGPAKPDQCCEIPED